MNYQIKTTLPKSEVENRIAMNVDFRSSLSIFNYPNKFFYGKKKGDAFELERVPMMFSRNSFAPVATISVVDSPKLPHYLICNLAKDVFLNPNFTSSHIHPKRKITNFAPSWKNSGLAIT